MIEDISGHVEAALDGFVFDTCIIVKTIACLLSLSITYLLNLCSRNNLSSEIFYWKYLSYYIFK